MQASIPLNIGKNELVCGLLTYNFKYDHLCDACANGEQVHSTFKPKKLH